jgi:hypothetical protein
LCCPLPVSLARHSAGWQQHSPSFPLATPVAPSLCAQFLPNRLPRVAVSDSAISRLFAWLAVLP